MERVVVTVKSPLAEYALDLELPARLAASELIPLLIDALAEGGSGAGPGTFDLIAFPPGRALRPDETLADAGTWDGAWVVLERRLA